VVDALKALGDIVEAQPQQFAVRLHVGYEITLADAIVSDVKLDLPDVFTSIHFLAWNAIFGGLLRHHGLCSFQYGANQAPTPDLGFGSLGLTCKAQVSFRFSEGLLRPRLLRT
jgi:hypothetical protein